MRGFLRRLVDLREGEAGPVLSTFLVLASLIAGHTMLETARDALFLGKLPPSRLTFVYVLLAGLALVVTRYNERFVRRFGRRNALVFTLVASAYGTTVLHFLPQTALVVFALYVWSGLLGTVLVVQFWLLAGQLFTVSQGKRLFGPIAAGGVLGAVIGASLAALLLMVVDVRSLLLVASTVFVAAALVLTSIQADDSRPPIDAKTTRAKKGGLGLLGEHPYLLRIAALVGLSTAAVLATDFLFKSVAVASMPKAQLGPFFARYYAVLNVAALVVQLFLAGPIVRRFGVVFAAAVLPLCLVAGGSGLLLTGGVLVLVLVAKGADGALRHSLHRVTSELLVMPLPAELRDRSKAVLESVMSRGVQAATAGLLFALATFFPDSPRVLTAVVVIFSMGWLAVAIGLRRPYVDLFRQALARGPLAADMQVADLDLNSVEAVMEALSSRDAARVVAAMELLDERKRARLIPGLVLYHESEEVLLRALAIVTSSDRSDWVPLTERLLGHPSEHVRVAAVRALSGRFPEIAARAQNDPSPAVRAHAAFCRVYEQKSRSPLNDLVIAGLLSLEGDEGKAAWLALLDAIRDRGDVRFADLLHAISFSDDKDVVARAALAMVRVTDPRFVPWLVARLDARDGRVAIRDALVAHGEAALDALEATMNDPKTELRRRLHVPRTVARFGSQRAADLLTAWLVRETNGLVRYKVLRSLGRLVADHRVRVDRAVIDDQLRKNLVENLRVLSLWAPLARGLGAAPEAARGSGSLVVGLLADKAEQALERAFRLLQIAHKHEDIRSVWFAVRSTDRRARAHAQEFLDALSRGNGTQGDGEDLRALLHLVADDLKPAERVERARAWVAAAPATYEAALRALLDEPDASLASLAVYHALELGDESLRDAARAARSDRPSLIMPTFGVDRDGSVKAPPGRAESHVG